MYIDGTGKTDDEVIKEFVDHGWTEQTAKKVIEIWNEAYPEQCEDKLEVL